MAENNMTRAWELYERGKMYNNSLVPNQYTLVNTNIEFFAGNQWVNMPESSAASRLPKPTFNIIKRVANLFVASLTSSAVTIAFDPLTYYDGNNTEDGAGASVYAQAEVRNLLEKFKMDYRVREALFDGAQTGDYCAHFYWDPDALPYGGAFGSHRGEIQMELVDGVNVMFGNPNDDNAERQPYILILGRDTVESLREEAGRARSKEHDMIVADRDYFWQAGQGGQTEILADDESGKALYVYMYTKRTHEETVMEDGKPKLEPVYDKKGDPVYELDENKRPILDLEGNPVIKMQEMRRNVTSVFVTKATKTAVIYEDVDTGLTRYPVAWGNWERQKNQYHGRALVTGIIPNQVFINSMFALVMRHLQLQSFPKTVYNADLISKWTNEVGQAIGVRNLQPGQDIGQAAKNLPPADMSTQIIACIDKAVEFTKECLGATDAQLGNVRPDNTSALMVLQSSAEVPLENVRAGLYEWMEDIGAILLDMMGTYYGSRPLVRDREFTEPVQNPDGSPVIDPNTGQMAVETFTRRVMEEYDFTQFKHLWLNVRVDAGATTYFSEIAIVQTLDNLRRDGTLELIDYLERVPDRLIPRKQELIDGVRRRTAINQASPVAANAKTVGALDETLPTLPGSVESRYKTLPKEAQRALEKKALLS